MADADPVPRQPMYYGETAPADELAPFIVAYWHFHVDPDAGEIEHVVPLDGSVSLVVGSRWRRLQVIGPTTRPMITRVRGGDVARGARLSPGAAPSLLPLAPAELRDRSLAREEHGLGDWGDETAAAVLDAVDEESAARAWDRAFAALLPASAPLDTVVMTAAAKIVAAGGDLSIRDLATQTGLSPRQFRRRFGAAVGLSPKEFARIRRFRTSLVGALGDSERRWAEIAAGFGFADQMHLIREYRRASGRTPGRLLGHLETIDHGTVLDR